MSELEVVGHLIGTVATAFGLQFDEPDVIRPQHRPVRCAALLRVDARLEFAFIDEDHTVTRPRLVERTYEQLLEELKALRTRRGPAVPAWIRRVEDQTREDALKALLASDFQSAEQFARRFNPHRESVCRRVPGSTRSPETPGASAAEGIGSAERDHMAAIRDVNPPRFSSRFLVQST